MPQRSIRAAINLVVAFAMTIGPLSSSAHVVAGHNPYALAVAEASRHAELSAATRDHGHSHEEGDTSERQPGHVHGHDPGDHVHEPFALNAILAAGEPGFAGRAPRPASETSDLDIKSSLNRPQRSLIG